MPTNKARINLSVPEEINRELKLLSKRDGMSLASKALELIRGALAFEEDITLVAMSENRNASASLKDYEQHKDVWK